MRESIGWRCLCALFATTTFATAFAAEPNEVTPLDAVTVYATRSPQSTFDIPSIVSTVDPSAAGNAAAGNISDLLEFTPSVEVSNGPRRNGQVISIRGFDDEAIITLIDGRRQNFESAHDGRFFIDPSLLKRVEIVKGASSAIYGGGAIGGVVAFETKDAADFLAPGETKGLLTSFGYRSASDEISPLITGFARVGGWDLLASINYRDSGDIEQGDGNKLDTEDKVLSGLFKAGYTFNDFHTVKFQAQVLNNDGQEPNNGTDRITSRNPLVDKEIKDKQYSVKYAYADPDNQWLNPKLHLYYSDTEVEEKDIAGNVNAGRVQVREINTVGLTIDNQSTLRLSDTHKQILSYGFEIYKDKQTGKNSLTGARAGVPDAKATNYGFYLQDEIALNTAIGDFLIIPAARFDQYKSDDKNGHSQDKNKLSPKLSVSYKPTKNVVLFGSWAKAFRAPNLTELYPSGQHFFRNNFIPNFNLKPETVRTVELGAGLNFDSVITTNDRVKIKGSFYESTGDNFITQEVNNRAGTTQNFNIDKAKLRGWELAGQYNINSLNARLGLSYVKATNDKTGEYLSNNVPLTLVTDVSYKISAMDSVIGWRGRFAEKNDRVGNNDIPTSGYGVHDLYYRWAPTSKQLQSLTVDVGIENIFDKAYTKSFATLLEAGRSYVAKVSYQW